MAGTQTKPFDPQAFKAKMREEWGTATAVGWRKWIDVIEAGGRAANEKIVALAGVGPGDVVLDVAAGYGEPGLTVAQAVQPGGQVVFSDISAEMLEFARDRAAEAGLDNVEFLECEAEELDFDQETFDAIVSRWGLMFLTDVAGTLQRLRSFLKPDGRLAAVVWGPPPAVQWSTAMPVVLRELELPPPPQDRPGMFALADAERLRTLVQDAGFRDVETGDVQIVIETESPQALTQLIRDVSAPISDLVKPHPPAVQERVWQKVTEAWAPFVTAEGRVRTVNQAIWVAATK